MSTKVTLEFPPSASRKRKFSPRNDSRRVSQAGRGRGRGGRGGRGHGRGRGRRRGGRGFGRGRGGGRYGDATNFNGVDVTDYTRSFTNEEMSRMGYEGRNHVFAKRSEGNQGRGRGRGGRGGGYEYQGRGGYEYQGRASGRGRGDMRQIDQASAVDDGQEKETAIVTYDGGNTSASHRAAQGRGGRAGSGFGRGAYGRG